jgi:hypothetical protein
MHPCNRWSSPTSATPPHSSSSQIIPCRSLNLHPKTNKAYSIANHTTTQLNLVLDSTPNKRALNSELLDLLLHFNPCISNWAFRLLVIQPPMLARLSPTRLLVWSHQIESHRFGVSKSQPKQIDLTYFRVLRCVVMEMKQMADLKERGISRGSHSIVKLNTTCETILLPLYYMA